MLKCPKRYKIVVVIPGGTFPEIEILLYYLSLNRCFDECHLWCNTDRIKDVKLMHEMESKYDFVQCKDRTFPEHGIAGIAKFMEQCVDDYTIYVRLDNDIVYMEQGSLERLIKYRRDNSNYFLVYSNLINNPITSCIHQNIGAIDRVLGNLTLDYNNELRHSSRWMEHVHNQFLIKVKNSEVYRYHFKEWVYQSNQFKMPINCIAWFGKTLNKMIPYNGNEEEFVINQNCINAICGSSIMVHLSYASQRLNGNQNLTSIRQQYYELINKKG